MQVLVNDMGLRVEVTDGSPHLPHRRDYSSTAGTGRGLKMVTAMVDRWGAHPHDHGKVVWFELVTETAMPSDDTPTEGLPWTDSQRADVVMVELLHVPLLMHSAWQEHASAILREYLLVRPDGADMTSIEMHAAASEAMSVLFAQIPAPRLHEDPEALMANATEPGVSSERLVVAVPRASVPHFQDLDAMLDEAMELADAGDLLAHPAQPEMRAMRRWLCQQVREQVAEGSPAPWSSGPDDSVLPTAADVDWHLEAVSNSSRALVAANDANRIIAVSGQALELLGYTDKAELLGHRLVAIIPPRYHQAHIAGFTLHLTNGRSPLLGRRVTVPVLRSDGTEDTVGLLVESRVLPHGRRLFIAELFAAGASGTSAITTG